MWLRGPIRDGAVEINRLVNFTKGVKTAFAEPWANVWYVDGESGNDGNTGREPYEAKKLIATAEQVANDNDVVYLKAGDHTMTAKVIWDLNDARLIGNSIIPMQPHLDIWQAALTTFSPMIEVSGRGNVFANMTFRHGSEFSSGVGYATDLVCMKVSGRYNYFENVYFYSPIYNEQDVATTYKGVHITGHNNYFRGCKFGSDGGRGEANYNVHIEGGIGNIFEDCIFNMVADSTSPFFVYINSVLRDMKYTIFKNCTFYAHSGNYVYTPADAFLTNSGGGAGGGGNTAGVVFDALCTFCNVSQITDTDKDDWVWKPMVSRDNHTGQIDAAVKTLIALKTQGA